LLKTLSGYALFERTDKRFAFRIMSAFLKPFFRRAVTVSIGADTPSYALGHWLEAQVGIEADRMTVLPNGVNVGHFKPLDSAQISARHDLTRFSHCLGYVGAMDTIRNIETAFGALSLLTDYPGIGLVLVGSGPYVEALHQKTIQMGLEEKVAFLGFQPYEDIPALISSFDIAFDLTCVYLSVNGAIEAASFSQKIPQYLACGIPTVAARTSDTAFLDESGVGVTVDPGDAPALAVAVRRILAADGQFLDSGAIRQYAIDRFSYDTVANRRMNYWQSRMQGVS
jgi:glycosyltransferase involved in cell wall biosynthesis